MLRGSSHSRFLLLLITTSMGCCFCRCPQDFDVTFCRTTKRKDLTECHTVLSHSRTSQAATVVLDALTNHLRRARRQRQGNWWPLVRSPTHRRAVERSFTNNTAQLL